MELDLIPVLVGADLNCYHVARAFHEEYGVISYAFGKYEIGATKNSKIISFTIVEQLDKQDIFLKILNEFADQHPSSSLLLMGCTDDYVSMIMENKKNLSQKYITPYIDKELRDKLILKESFYQFCENYNLPYPKTFLYKKEMEKQSATILDAKNLGFSYPIIIKPSSSVLYWKYPFDGMKKVYRAHSKEEAAQIIQDIYKSGYPANLILQDTIPGDDSYMYVLTAYSDQNGKVRMMCLGHVLLEEHTPKGLGNHAAILTEYKPELMKPLQQFLESIGYIGFSNFDIKWDERDATYRLFEINLRQGRSNYYVTGAGVNIAKCVVDDWILKNPFSSCEMVQTESFWCSIPVKIVYQYVKDTKLTDKVKELVQKKRATSSFDYAYDLKGNFKRRFYILANGYRHFGKFKKYYQ